MVVRPFQSQTYAKIRMYQPEQELVELTFKHFFQELVAFVAGAASVAVDEEELLSFDGLDDGFTVQLNPQLVMQISEAPKVVVADEQMHRNACISELGQLALKPDKPFGNHGLVLKPEVEQVAHQVKFFAVGTDAVKETQKFLFALLAVLKRGNAQVEIRDEINGHQRLISDARRMSSVMRVTSFGSTALTALMTSSWVMVTG